MSRVKLVKTCVACPEQYDALVDGQVIGYLRLRHGFFRAEYHGQTVYSAGTEGDGSFKDHERVGHLNRACTAILAAHYAAGSPVVSPEPIYDVEDKFEE